jgi:hypothetical protein
MQVQYIGEEVRVRWGIDIFDFIRGLVHGSWRYYELGLVLHSCGQRAGPWPRPHSARYSIS